MRAASQGALGARISAVREATAAGNHIRAVHLADSLLSAAPHHPTVVLVRAVALATAARDADAADAIRRLLRWDPRYARRALQDSALSRLRDVVDGTAIYELARLADQPVGRGDVYATIEERDLVPEGTAWDWVTRSLLVGSLNKNTVVAIDSSGRVTHRVPRRSHGLGSVAGIHVDSARGVLWVTSNPRYDTPSDTTASALFAFEAPTGAFLSRVAAPAGAFLNDVTSAPDGTVYVTDSRGGRVLHLRPGAQALAVYVAAGPNVSPNGITISHTGSHLFVADLDHIHVIERSTSRSWRLAVPDSTNVTGIDGLAFAGNSLIAHHPLVFWRIARYELDARFERITRTDFIEYATPDSRTSTTGEVVGESYYYIGNGQLDRMNQRTLDSATMEPIRMYRAPVSPGPRVPPARNRTGGPGASFTTSGATSSANESTALRDTGRAPRHAPERKDLQDACPSARPSAPSAVALFYDGALYE